VPASLGLRLHRALAHLHDRLGHDVLLLPATGVQIADADRSTVGSTHAAVEDAVLRGRRTRGLGRGRALTGRRLVGDWPGALVTPIHEGVAERSEQGDPERGDDDGIA